MFKLSNSKHRITVYHSTSETSRALNQCWKSNEMMENWQNRTQYGIGIDACSSLSKAKSFWQIWFEVLTKLVHFWTNHMRYIDKKQSFYLVVESQNYSLVYLQYYMCFWACCGKKTKLTNQFNLVFPISRFAAIFIWT